MSGCDSEEKLLIQRTEIRLDFSEESEKDTENNEFSFNFPVCVGFRWVGLVFFSVMEYYQSSETNSFSDWITFESGFVWLGWMIWWIVKDFLWNLQKNFAVKDQWVFVLLWSTSLVIHNLKKSGKMLNRIEFPAMTPQNL